MSDIAWSPRDAAFGAVISAAAAVVIATGHVENGLYLLIGALPAAILGLPPLRKDRRRVLVIGIIFGVSIMIGSILAQWVAVAIVGMFVLGLGAALLTTRKPLGFVVMTTALPLVGIGLTYVGLEHSARLSLLFIGGSAIALVVALCFPEHTAPAEVQPPLLSTRRPVTTASASAWPPLSAPRSDSITALSTSAGSSGPHCSS